MENIAEAKKLINEASNIYVVCRPTDDPEGIACALALFYTLNDLKKNVNLIIENIPESLKFLTPSVDFISYPKNFVISIPNKLANVSQVYYEKTSDNLKIHLTLENGAVKKDDISFYFSETKPDLIITIGIDNFQSQLTERLNSFGFLLDSAILNIDNKQNNENFGRINIVKEASLAEIVFNVINNPEVDLIKKETANCLLSGLVIYTENFKSHITADVFEIASILIKKGADLNNIKENIKT